MPEYMKAAMRTSLREVEIIRNFKIPKVGKELEKEQSPWAAFITRSLEQKTDFLVLPNDHASAPKPSVVQQLIRSIRPDTPIVQSQAEDETLEATNMLVSMNEEPLLPTPGIGDEYEDISSAAESMEGPVNPVY